jgi:putative PIN family toxin of toxin-antitoxin system
VRIVLDTNLLVAALQSRRGASNAILLRVGTGVFDTALSVSLMFEYEDVLSRPEFNFDQERVSTVLDYLAAVSIGQTIRYLWRPFLNDPKDDLVLELAFNAGCQYIVTFNLKDFKRSQELGIEAIKPKDFLKLIGGSP